MSAVADFVNETLTVPVLKLRARKYYIEHENALADMSCGRFLGKHISVAAQEAAAKFNNVMAQLEELDPSAPKGVRL